MISFAVCRPFAANETARGWGARASETVRQ
jgi:hypothetical protein